MGYNMLLPKKVISSFLITIITIIIIYLSLIIARTPTTLQLTGREETVMKPIGV